MKTRRARVVCAAMQKGGVGKTTSVLNLARAASIRGIRVLVVDLDPQGNTTTTLAKDDVRDPTVADAIAPRSDCGLEDVLVPTIWDGVTLAPAETETLTAAEEMISGSKAGREYRLREALEPVLGDYDLVLIDNAPALGLLLVNSLTASDEVFVVVQADQYSADGLAELHRTVRGVKRYNNQGLIWSGVLISMWRGTSDEKYWMNEIIENFTEEVKDEDGGSALRPVAAVWDKDIIPLWTGIKTTLNAGQGLDQASESKLRVLAHTYRRIIAHWVPDEEVTI